MTYLRTRVVYVCQIPMSREVTCIGQTGRYVNDRVREHATSARSTPSGRVAVHRSGGACTPASSDTMILHVIKCRETFEIKTKGKTRISETSSDLSTNEYEYVKRGLCLQYAVTISAF